MKMNKVKTENALRRIKKRRRGDKESEINQGLLQEVDGEFVEFPDGILPKYAEVLRHEYKSYSIME